jgi:hypothetical protein
MIVLVQPGLVGEGESFPTYARVQTYTGVVLVDTDVTSWDLQVYDLDGGTPDVPLYTLLLQAVTGVVLTALTTGGAWGLDTVGYNFAHVLTDQGFEGGHRIKKEYRLNTTSYGKVFIVHTEVLQPRTMV